MKRVLFGTTTAISLALSTTAYAEVGFSRGVATIDYTTWQNEGPSFLDVELSAAFIAGSYGFQIDVSQSQYVGEGQRGSVATGYGLHFYRQLSNDSKIGAFVYKIGLGDGQGPENSPTFFGVEGISSFGAVDVEASISTESNGRRDLGNYIELRGQGNYGLQNGIEITAGVLHIFYTDCVDCNSTWGNIGASYLIPNTALEVGAYYSSLLNNDKGNHFGVNVSLHFGPDSGARLFSNKSYFSGPF